MAGALVIGVVCDPEHHPDWPSIRDFLKPAAERGDIDILIGEHELLWAVFESGQPIAAATTRLTTDDVVEVVLVGGKDFRRWLRPLDQLIGRWAKDEGAHCLRAFGREGWGKVLGWAVIGRCGDFTAYERRL